MRLTLYTEATSVAGAEISAGNLVAALDPAIEIGVVGVDDSVANAIASRRPGTRTTILRSPGGKTDVRALTAHLRAFRHQRPDVVQVNLQTPWVGSHGILAGILGGYPVITVEQLPYPSASRLQRRVRRLMCRRLAAHVAVGEGAARRTEEVIGLSTGSVETIYQGVPDLPPSETAPAGQAAIGAIGRLAPQKGFDLLLRALARLPDDVTCMIVGDGPERANLERLAADLGLADRVTFTGWAEQPREYLPGFELVAMPSRFEGLPLLAIEAALLERPVVAAAAYGLPDVVDDGGTGVLVPPEDPVALAEAIAGLLRDPARRAAMGRRARARALEQFSVEGMARSYEQLYHRVLGMAPG
jgi:glycosyltransferase involved in cell wall biosynthesis